MLSAVTKNIEEALLLKCANFSKHLKISKKVDQRLSSLKRVVVSNVSLRETTLHTPYFGVKSTTGIRKLSELFLGPYKVVLLVAHIASAI